MILSSFQYLDEIREELGQYHELIRVVDISIEDIRQAQAEM